jgi:hypothetical protein
LFFPELRQQLQRKFHHQKQMLEMSAAAQAWSQRVVELKEAIFVA